MVRSRFIGIHHERHIEESTDLGKNTKKSSPVRAAALRIAGACGILAPVISFSLISVAILRSTGFMWAEDYLSDLGVRGNTAALFNSGLIAGGVLFAAFALGLRWSFLSRNSLGHLAAYVLLLDSCALGAIGFLPADYGLLHVGVAAVFYVLIPAFLLFSGVSMIASARGRLGWLTFGVAILTAALELAPWPWRGGAIPEALTLVPMAAWSVALGARLLVSPER